jgi:hypothetical protein
MAVCTQPDVGGARDGKDDDVLGPPGGISDSSTRIHQQATTRNFNINQDAKTTL